MQGPRLPRYFVQISLILCLVIISQGLPRKVVASAADRAAALTSARPDLRPSALTTPSTARGRDRINVTWTIANDGTASARPHEDKLYLSTDATWNSNDTYLLGVSVAETLNANNTYSRTVSPTLPNVASGTYYLIVRTDTSGVVDETNESNNNRAQAIAITQLMPDLQPTAFTAPNTGRANTAIAVSWTVANNGADGAYSHYDGVFFSTDNQLSSNDARLASVAMTQTLAVGARYDRAGSITLPSVAAGNYWLLVQTDNYSNVAESNETNNVRALAISVTTAAPTPTTPRGTPATSTRTASATTAVPTGTRAATATATSTATSTATATRTATSTATSTATATNTAVPTATNTAVPTATSTNTPVPTATNTPVPTATNTAVPTATNTAVPTATNTAVPTATNTATATNTNTSVPTATNTAVPSATATNTSVPTATNTATATNTVTATTVPNTPTITPTPLGPAPVARITSPIEGAELEGSVTITGDATSGTLLDWTLDYRLAGDSTYTTLAVSTTAALGRALGSFDPSLVLPGMYELRLTTRDTQNRATVATVNIIVAVDQPIGNFSMPFTDLDIPMAGMPIQINRTYDSRDKQTGDFGAGWSLNMNNTKVQENGVLGLNWQGSVQGSWFFIIYCFQPSKRHLVTITLPDNSVHRFEASTDRPCEYFSPPQYVNIVFTPLPGTTSRLRSLDFLNTWVDFYGGRIENYYDTDPIEVDRYRLTLDDGRMLDIDQSQGLQRIQDANGNVISITSDGVTHSGGKGVAFERDTEGRITSITDPAGNVQRYAYGPTGDLLSHTNRLSNTMTFRYNRSHGLVEVRDPLGNAPARMEYDDTGRLVASTDADGNRIEYDHDIEGNREVVRDRRGNPTVYVYDDAGNVLSKTNVLGQTMHYTYDANGNELTRTDSLGQTSTKTYDANGNVLTETDGEGHTITKTYNGRNQVLTETDRNGHTTTRTYDIYGKELTETDALGNTTTNTYDASGNLVSTTDAAGNTSTYTFDTAGNRVSYTNPLGQTSHYEYDQLGNVVRETSFRTTTGGITETLVTQRTWDANGQMLTETDPQGNVTRNEYNPVGRQTALVDTLGRRTTYAYDDRGNLTTTTYPDGTTETISYDPNGNRISSTDRAGRTTTYAYNAADKLVRTTHPDGTTNRSEYDAAGREIAKIDERGNRVSWTYNANNQRLSATDPFSNTTYYTYNAGGYAISMTDALSHTIGYAYDAAGQQTRTLFADGSTKAVEYDKLGRKSAEIDQAGRRTSYSYDLVGNLTKVTDALSGTTSFTYDEQGHRLSQTDANGHTTTWVYDSLGRALTRTLPLGMSEHWTYDAIGNVLTHTDFNGHTSTMTYDRNDRLSTRTIDGTTTRWTYTAPGQTATVEDGRGTTSYAYDRRDRMTSATYPGGASLAYTYDDAGNRASLAAPSGTTRYTYDALNRLQTVVAPNATTTRYSYDVVGNRIGAQLPNGARTRWIYDALNRLKMVENFGTDGTTVLSSFSYTLGATGNRTRVVEHDGRAVDYTYDALYRLTEERVTAPGEDTTTTGYTYDAVGNRISKTENGQTASASYDSNDRLLVFGASRYEYDSNGNLLERTVDGDTTTLTYNRDNQLVGVTDPEGTSSFTYDALGNRVSETANGQTTRYLTDTNRPNAEVVEERAANNDLIVAYVQGDDLIQQTRRGVVSFYQYDGQGSTRALISQGGATTDTYTYDAFGVMTGQTGTTTNDYLFTGEHWNPNVGFYYLRARFYDPSMGRFLSMDSYLGSPYDPATLHKYLYAHNNPVNMIDPSGHNAVALPGLIGIEGLLGTLGGISAGTIFGLLIFLLIFVLVLLLLMQCITNYQTSYDTAVGSGGMCDVTHENIFYSGIDTPLTTQHISDAQSGAAVDGLGMPLPPRPSVLHRSAAHSRGWYNRDARCMGRPSGMVCDEYPFATAAEGGQANNPSIRPIPSWEQSLQGGRLSAFYGMCAIGIGVDYRVVPTTASISRHECR